MRKQQCFAPLLGLLAWLTSLATRTFPASLAALCSPLLTRRLPVAIVVIEFAQLNFVHVFKIVDLVLRLTAPTAPTPQKLGGPNIIVLELQRRVSSVQAEAEHEEPDYAVHNSRNTLTELDLLSSVSQ